jgi:signal transduction histidine kinase
LTTSDRRRGERRADERERQRLTEQLIAAEQDERRRLALFLHDGPVQNLAGIALMLDAALAALNEGRPDDAKQVLEKVLSRQRETIQSLRDLSFNLEPVVLRDAGFEAAVRHLAEQVGLTHEIQVALDVAAGDSLAKNAQVALYQVIRETLTQATRRSPTTVRIELRDGPNGEADLVVADDGHAERRRASAEALEERVQPFGGQLSIVRDDDGTTVHVTLPAYAAR